MNEIKFGPKTLVKKKVRKNNGCKGCYLNKIKVACALPRIRRQLKHCNKGEILVEKGKENNKNKVWRSTKICPIPENVLLLFKENKEVCVGYKENSEYFKVEISGHFGRSIEYDYWRYL